MDDIQETLTYAKGACNTGLGGNVRSPVSATTLVQICGQDHQKLELKPAGHEPSLYAGMYRGEQVLLKKQVDGFELARAKPVIARMVFDKVDAYLTFPLKQMGLVTLFNGIDIDQTRDYIKISVETYLERVCEKHMNE